MSDPATTPALTKEKAKSTTLSRDLNSSNTTEGRLPVPSPYLRFNTTTGSLSARFYLRACQKGSRILTLWRESEVGCSWIYSSTHVTMLQQYLSWRKRLLKSSPFIKSVVNFISRARGYASSHIFSSISLLNTPRPRFDGTIASSFC